MKLYITVTGMQHYYGTDFVKPDMEFLLVKEPENEFDKEAIRVEAEGIGKIGYVANSVRTVVGDTMSAGRLYDRIGTVAHVKVKYVFANALVCKVRKKDIRYWPVDIAEEDGEEAIIAF